METSSTAGIGQVQELYRSLAERYATEGLQGLTAGNEFVLAMIAVAFVALVLLLVLAIMPAQRKVVRRQRVRRTRRAVAAGGAVAQPAVAKPVPSEAAAASQDADEASTPSRSRRRVGRLLVPIVWGVVVVAAFIATYVVTGSNQYCGRSCHVEDSQVVLAVENPHGDCIDCHEAGPVSGMVSRIRMAVAYSLSRETPGSVPVDPALCLRCHEDIEAATLETATGLRVSHSEILASGRTCSDCHDQTGHREGRSFVGRMSRCTGCHDGVIAQRECDTCHVGGSPVEAVRNGGVEGSKFDYPPVRVASRDCARCHGVDEACVDCHNGFQLPHPRRFVEHEHARIAAFDGKNRCFKCHSITWCGDSRCHHSFSAHDEKRWRVEHRDGTSKTCGSCHIAWDGRGDFCEVCH